MLAALLMAYLLGGGGVSAGILTPDAVKQIDKRVEASVSDGPRAEAAGAALVELKAEVKAFDKQFARSGKHLTNLYKDHGSDSAQMLGVLDELDAGWEASQRRALDLRFDLREAMTEDEWAAVFGDG